jgi:hypothetical protein
MKRALAPASARFSFFVVGKPLRPAQARWAPLRGKIGRRSLKKALAPSKIFASSRARLRVNLRG